MDSKAYAKEHKQAFIAKVVKGKVPVLEEKLAIFMAGTPGAGKTEVVESLMEFAEVFIRSYLQMIDNLSIVKETFNDAISYRVVDNIVGYVKGRIPRMVDDLLDVVLRFYTRQELEDLLDN